MKLYLKAIVYLLLLVHTLPAIADGSKDLYPEGVRGARAFMETEVLNGGVRYHRYYNNGRHFAYAKAGEILAVASSAQGIGNGTIKVFSPSGRELNTPNLNIGRITGSNGMSNRRAELAGPRVGYDAFEVLVDEEGIWTIEFTSPGNSSNMPNIRADSEWWQSEEHNFIAAWDISIRNVDDTEWLRGRVYANVINLHLNGGGMRDAELAYYGVNYVLTKDGYYYRVDGNGSIGLRFTYFVNNSGILTSTNTPSYKSSRSGFYASLHDPNSNDIGNQFITHKIFYTLPDEALPKSSYNKFGDTWLLNEIQIPKVSNIKIGSSEGTVKNINTKGALISFETNFSGRYKVVIRSKVDSFYFPPKEIIIQSNDGQNEFVWDGKDGEGKLVPIGQYEITVSIASIEGEVHFPYFDMEINPNGLKLERLNRLDNTLEPAILYWDDSDIPLGNIVSEHSNPIVNLDGIPSNINGHRWGTYSSPEPNYQRNDNLGTGNYSFGNNMAMDTWSYAVHIEETTEKEILVEVADLEVVSVVADKDTIELNEMVKYTIAVRNNGPSDVIDGKFEYSLPLGFNINALQLHPSDCASLGNTAISNNTLHVVLNIKNGCEVKIDLSASANNVPDATYGTVIAEAGVVRPRGFTDPDATLNNIASLAPKSALEECSPNGCNNIKTNTDVFLLEPFNERGQMAVLKTVKHLDKNGSGFQEEGEILEYTFTIRNIGQVDIDDLVITDSLLNPSLIVLGNVIVSKGEEFSITIPYTITADDVRRKKVVNRAFILGKNPRNFDVKDISGTAFTNDDTTTIDIDTKPLLQLKKSVINKGTGENAQFTLNDTIVYRFEVLHQGDIGIHQIKIFDQLLFSTAQTISTNQIDNKTILADFSYIINNSDILRGYVENSAIVEALDVKYNNVLLDTSGNSFIDNQKTITQLARPPKAFSDYIEIYQSQNPLLNILDNDQKGSSDWKNGGIEIIEQPSKGSLTVTGTSVRFMQYNNRESGSDFFTYRLHDNSRLTSEIVRVDIEILKTVPIAVDDIFVQYYNRNIKITPAKNDYVEFSELDLESISIINQPVNGILVYLGNGEFSYESDKTFSGVDEFTYRIMDKNGNWSEPGTVKIEISGILVPNVITPNGDGLNDTFEIIGIYQFENVELQVFDRFKNLIYQSSNYQNNWVVNSSVRDGTYFYSIKFNKTGERPIIRKGSLLITREMLN